MRRLREPPPTLASDIPPAVLAVVDRALATDPERRWPSAGELARAARVLIASSGRASVPSQRSAPASAPVSPVRTAPAPPPTMQAPPPALSVQAPQGQTSGAPGFPPTSYRVSSPYSAGAPRPTAEAQSQNALGWLGLGLGIGGVAMSFCCWLGLPMSVAGIVLGALGMRKAADGQADNRTAALVGVVCGASGAALSIILFAVFYSAGIFYR